MNKFFTYFGTFIWMAFLWYIAEKSPGSVTKKERINDKTVTRYNWIFVLLVLIPMIYIASKRSRYFGDTGMYWNGFQRAPSSFSAIPAYIEGVKKDKAFYTLMAILRCILGNRPVVYFGIMATIQSLLLSKTLRKYSGFFLTSIFIFIASTDYISFMFNAVRQFLAVTIIFASSKFIFERNYIPAIIMVFIASRFHATALLMIPVVFIVQGQPWNKSTVLVLFLTFLAIIYINQFTSILDNMLEETQYTNVVSEWTTWNDNGTNPLRVAVYCVPALLSLIGLRYIREENDPVINVCTNMAVITAGLYLISMATSGIFMGRLPIYASMYSNCILLPWEVDHFFNRRSGQIIKVLMIVLFLIFYYYQVHFTWGLL